MGVTAKELAARLGLSEAAVSLALHDKRGVSRDTRRRVIDAAHALGYDFSRIDTAAGGKKGTICFVIYRKSGAVVDDTPFFAALSEGISTGCDRKHYDCAIRYVYEDEKLATQLDALAASRFSGIILLATEMDEASLGRFSAPDAPVVVLDAYFEKLAHNYVMINNIQGAFIATEYLIKKRRAQPGYLRSAYPISNFDQRADGFYKAIRASGMSTSKSLVHRLTPSQEGAYADMKNLLQSGEEPADCYFADNDLIAIGALHALREAGYRVPEDVGIVGFDDLPACEYMSPPLSTVEVPKHFMGEVAALRMVQLIEGENALPVKIEVAVALVKRGSA